MPSHLAAEIVPGSLVRVPLSGRRVRGWVVELGFRDPDRLKDIAGVSSAVPVFESPQLEALRWAARHYVAPISVLLAKATPPNLPKSIPALSTTRPVDAGGHPLASVAGEVAEGKRRPVQALVGPWRDVAWIPGLGTALGSGRSVAVICASVAEAELVAGEARKLFGDTVVLAHGAAAALTRAWESAQVAARLVVGTPRLAVWRISSLGLAVVLEENRRAMKERQTPTLHVREVMRTRSLLEGFTLAFLGPTPSVENLASGAEITRVGSRAWPLVEVVDRSEEPPGSGFLSQRVMNALAATARSGSRAFVFTHRRRGGAAMRCTRCRTLRSCTLCGSPLGRGPVCRRCGADAPAACVSCRATEFEELGTVPSRLTAEINARLGREAAAVHPTESPISVGTERDLAALPPMGLVVAADADGLLMAPGYRASEEALRLLARLANSLERGPGRRMMVQTAHPGSDLITTLTRGDPIPYLEKVLVERARDGLPPAVEMMAIELREHIPPGVSEELGGLEDATLLGPVEIEGGQRWLLAGRLGKARLALRPKVGRWREAGATVRIDADPIEI